MHLLFSEAKILALPEATSHPVADRIFQRRAFNARWAGDLRALKQSMKKYGASERSRVEFMVDDRAAEDYIEQKRRTAWKAENILKLVSRLHRNKDRVLHIGCGGECNEAIPAHYRQAGFVNFGVDAVRSYVKEFAAWGEAQLANASALPYGDGVFDVVNFTDILENLFDPLRGLREAARVLKKNGHLVLETPNRSCLNRRDPLSWLEHLLDRLHRGLVTVLEKIAPTGKWVVIARKG